MIEACTRHAAQRMRARAIPEAAVELLFRFFDHAARRRVADALGDEGVRGVEHWLDAYLVLGCDGALVTAGWRTRRLRRR